MTKRYTLPTAATPEAVMLRVAGAKCRIHIQPPHPMYEYRRYWVESRYTHRRGWWAVLWPWPHDNWAKAIRFGGGIRASFVQLPGETLPIYCTTRAEAVAWAWTLAEQHGYPENDKRRRFVRERVR